MGGVIDVEWGDMEDERDCPFVLIKIAYTANFLL